MAPAVPMQVTPVTSWCLDTSLIWAGGSSSPAAPSSALCLGHGQHLELVPIPKFQAPRALGCLVCVSWLSKSSPFQLSPLQSTPHTCLRCNLHLRVPGHRCLKHGPGAPEGLIRSGVTSPKASSTLEVLRTLEDLFPFKKTLAAVSRQGACNMGATGLWAPAWVLTTNAKKVEK